MNSPTSDTPEDNRRIKVRHSGDRLEKLIRAVAMCHDLHQPIDEHFNQHHRIRSEELSVFNEIAHILRGFLTLPVSRQVEIRLLGQGVPISVVRDVAHDLRMKEILEQILQQAKGHTD